MDMSRTTKTNGLAEVLDKHRDEMDDLKRDFDRSIALARGDRGQCEIPSTELTQST